jgi:hypothetical protein
MKASVEKRLRKLEEEKIYMIDSLAAFSIYMARRQRGDTPAVVRWEPNFKRKWDALMRKNRRRSD